MNQLALKPDNTETAGALMRDEPRGAMTPMQMISAAIESGQGIEVLDKLMALQERWEANQGRKAFDNAMAAVKAELPVVMKSREVDFTTQKGRTNYRYEDFAQIAKQIDPVLTRHGLSYRFRTEQLDGGMVKVTCIIAHRDGHFVENSLSAGRDESGNKNNIQAVGSTVTYLQRYTLKAALGIAVSADDDGKGSEPLDLITEDQVIELRELAESVDADVKAFCKYLRVETLADLPASRFAGAVAALEKKRGA